MAPRRRLLRLAAAALALLTIPIASCADLRPLPAGTCGNAVIDAFEDCDGFGFGALTECAPPGAPNECRFVCGGEAATECPVGWGCGSDGVCRQSSGAFRPLGDLVPFPPVHRLLSGDFNGDGLADALVLGEHDALGRSPARIIAPPSTTLGARVTSVSRPLAAPAVGPMAEGGGAPIVFADRGGVALVRSTLERESSYAAFAGFISPPGSFLRAIPIDVLPEDLGDELVYLVDRKELGATLERPTGPLDSKVLISLPGGELALAGPIVTGRFNEVGPCPALVFAFAGADHALVFTPCLTMGASTTWNVGGAPFHVGLPGGATIDRPTLVVDMNLDGHQDLLIGAGGEAYVAWGRGDGTFGSDPAGGQLNAAGLYNAIGGAAGAFPLAVADINDDAMVDFVVPEGVIMSHAGAYSLTFENVGEPWDHAVIADLNDNGAPDIVAGSLVGLDLAFLNNAGGGVLNPAIIATSGSTENLAVGDFDGDLVNDVAFMVVLDRPGARIDELTVAFGEAHGPPKTTASVARLTEIEQISAARLPDSTGADGISDIICISQDDTETDDVYSFHGEGGRVMLSPLPLHDMTTDALPIALAFGSFDGEPGDVGAVGVDAGGRLTLWHVHSATQLALEMLQASAPLPDSFNVPITATEHLNYPVHAVAVDLQGGGGHDQMVVAAAYGAGGAALVIADYDPATKSFTARPEQPFAANLSEDSLLAALDVDGDDLPDLVLSTGLEGAPGDVLVFWNDGHGGVLTGSPTHLAMPGGVRGFACLPSSSGRGCALVLTSETGTSIATAGADRAFDVAPAVGLPAGRGVAAGDFDGDGLTDVVIVEDFGVQFFTAVPNRS